MGSPTTCRSLPHPDWLTAQFSRLLDFAEQFVPPRAQFSFLGTGTPDLILACRMTHAFALGAAENRRGAAEIVDAGVAALRNTLADTSFGGWASTETGRKRAYDHVFVVLAASTALIGGSGSAAPLLDDALAVLERRFWDDDIGVLKESFDRDWSGGEAYLGANANMHAVEAYLAASRALDDDALAIRALRIADSIMRRQLGGAGIPVEHFDPALEPIPSYNQDSPADQVRPYGSTVGHWMEWARLLVELDRRLASPPSWLRSGAEQLFGDAMRFGWAVDGAPGFIYTLDWDATVSVDSRLHWVLAEAIAAASALSVATGSRDYDRCSDQFWSLAIGRFIRLDGSWHHELDCRLNPLVRVWNGRPDAYHVSTALLAARARQWEENRTRLPRKGFRR